jgi:hypothetical protein
MAEGIPKAEREGVELFNLDWIKTPENLGTWGDGRQLDGLKLSDTDAELLQMGLVALIKGNKRIVDDMRSAEHRNPFPTIDKEIDVAGVLEGTAGDAQELLNRLIMLTGRNLAENGW